MSPTAEIALRKVNIASLATGVTGLCIWLVVLGRILVKKAKLTVLSIICCLMIAYFVFQISLYQI